MSLRRKLAAAVTLLLAVVLLHAVAQSNEEDHKPSILGVELGMTGVQVVERFAGRNPDGRKDEPEFVHLIWKVSAGTAQVSLRKDRVWRVTLQYAKPRPTTEFWLRSSTIQAEGLDVPDPRIRRDYQFRQNLDKTRYIWTRSEKTAEGFRAELGFMSTSLLQMGKAQFGNFIEYKYVGVAIEDTKKFEKAFASAEKKP